MAAIDLPPDCAGATEKALQALERRAKARSFQAERFQAERLTKRFGPIVSGTQFVAG